MGDGLPNTNGVELEFKGVGVSPGIVNGPAFVLAAEEDAVVVRDITAADVPRELARYEQALVATRKQIRDLQQLFLEIPEKKEDPLEKLRILIKKLAEIKNLVLVAMGFSPNKPITWWIIFGIILFLGVLSGVFYMAWLKKLQENKWVKRGSGELQPEPPPSTDAEKEKEKEESEKAKE